VAWRAGKPPGLGVSKQGKCTPTPGSGGTGAVEILAPGDLTTDDLRWKFTDVPHGWIDITLELVLVARVPPGYLPGRLPVNVQQLPMHRTPPHGGAGSAHVISQAISFR
jgi:hypothetical protein